MKIWVDENNLKLHSNKTRIKNCRVAEKSLFFWNTILGKAASMWGRNLNKLRGNVRELTPQNYGQNLKIIIQLHLGQLLNKQSVLKNILINLFLNWLIILIIV